MRDRNGRRTLLRRLRRFRSNPAINLGYLEFPEPAKPVGRHAFGGYPSIDRVSGNTEMSAHFLHGRPAFVWRWAARAGLRRHKHAIVAKSSTTCTEIMTWGISERYR